MIGSTIRSTRGSVAADLVAIDRRIDELTSELKAALEERATVEAMARLAGVIDVDTKPQITGAAA